MSIITILSRNKNFAKLIMNEEQIFFMQVGYTLKWCSISGGASVLLSVSLSQKCLKTIKSSFVKIGNLVHFISKRGKYLRDLGPYLIV